MKANIWTKYGPPEVLQLKEIEKLIKDSICLKKKVTIHPKSHFAWPPAGRAAFDAGIGAQLAVLDACVMSFRK